MPRIGSCCLTGKVGGSRLAAGLLVCFADSHSSFLRSSVWFTVRLAGRCSHLWWAIT
ncbi:hypothetical protein PR003_g24187 [Phytophthora rubi]|uniref:Uncharacterized protein n=1 Tax=Phytophthora rubi TaxID=129364 RepID=A0A6A4CR04_9STRA|nr:hypothetical protein PR002_g19791 [Phytophthora rubi]KAE9294761.1 hypothetical protein PR003_g24187 [Phytophthora rubi]